MEEEVIFISGNTPSSKNSRVWTGKYFIPSAPTRKWIKNTKKEWENQKQKFLDLIAGLPTPYYVEFTFIRKTKRRFDYCNIVQAPLDQMKLYGWIEDDNSAIVKPYFGDFKHDKNKPGLYIKVLKTKPNHGI